MVHSKNLTGASGAYQRREYQPGERISVNGTTVQLEGRWVDVVDVETRVCHDYRATSYGPARINQHISRDKPRQLSHTSGMTSEISFRRAAANPVVS